MGDEHDAGNYGFEFDENKTNEIREMKNQELIPFVIACDKEIKDERRFYFITNSELQRAMNAENRPEFSKIIFNKVEPDHLFRNPITYEDVLTKLKSLGT